MKTDGTGETKKRKPGRPTKLMPEMYAQVTRLAMLGMTNEQMARFFEVGGATFDAWMARDAEFQGAVKKGREDADARVVASLYQRATGYVHDVQKVVTVGGAAQVVEYTERLPPDPVSAIFWLKNRQNDRWNDRRFVKEDPLPTAEDLMREIAARLPK